MPSRILKESICTSEDIAKLSFQAEVLFYRLLVKVDDFGLYHGNVKIIKNMCYPLQADSIKDAQLKTWLAELVRSGMVILYINDGKQYLQIKNWRKHQQKRADKPKFPLPQTSDINCNQVITDDINGMQVIADSLANENENVFVNENVNEKRETRNENVYCAKHPTADEVRAYCQERGNSVDAKRFVDYYTANGWKVGRNAMKDWQAAVRTWERNAQGKQEKGSGNIFLDMLKEDGS